MSIPFITVERGRPGHPEVPVKYYPSLQSKGRVTLHDLAEEASDMSTLTTADMAAAIEALLILIPRPLADGEVVELGDFGNIWLQPARKAWMTRSQSAANRSRPLLHD